MRNILTTSIVVLLVMVFCAGNAFADRFYSRGETRNPGSAEAVQPSHPTTSSVSAQPQPRQYRQPQHSQQPQQLQQPQQSQVRNEHQQPVTTTVAKESSNELPELTNAMYEKAVEQGTLYESEEKAKAAFRAAHEDKFTPWASSDKEKAAWIPDYTYMNGSCVRIQYYPQQYGCYSGYWGYNYGNRVYRYSIWDDPWQYNRIRYNYGYVSCPVRPQYTSNTSLLYYSRGTGIWVSNSGYRNYHGYSGYRGYSGYHGYSGYRGYSGYHGYSGYRGNSLQFRITVRR